MPTDGVEPYVRRDTQHADPAHRPTKAQYDRYIWLVQRFRGLGWDNSRLHDASPFRIVDPGLQRHPDPRLRRSRRPGRRARRAGPGGGEPRPRRARGWRRWSGSGASRTASISASTGPPASSSTAPRSAACWRPSPPCRAARAAAVARTIERLAGRTRLHRAVARSGRPALRQQALLARAGLARRQLHDRRRAGARRRDRGRRADPRSRASS